MTLTRRAIMPILDAMRHVPDMRRCTSCNEVYDAFDEGQDFVCGRCDTLWGSRCDWFPATGPMQGMAAKSNGTNLSRSLETPAGAA